MSEVVGGFQTHEEWRTRALLVAWRASRAGEPPPGDFLLRRSRNPLAALTDEEYERYCKGRLAATTALRDAAGAEPDRFAPVHEAGRCEGGVYDVVDLPCATLEDVIDRRQRPDPAALHRALERILDACAAFNQRSGRAHGAVTPAAVFLDDQLLGWGGVVRLGEAPAVVPPREGAAVDLRALGRIMHLLALHREPDPSIFSDDGDAAPFHCFGRSGARHRRLCSELLTASPARADFGFEEARAALHACRPPTPGARRAMKVGAGGALAAVVAGSAVGGWILTRPEIELGTPPPKRQFDDAKVFAVLLNNALGRAADPALQDRLATPEFQDAIGLLSGESLKGASNLGDWFSAGRSAVNRPGADFHRLIKWTVPNVDAWQAAHDSAIEQVRLRLIEPLREASTRAAGQGWSDAARDAQSAADRCASLIENGELRALADFVDDAAAQHARFEGWFTSLAEARARTGETVDAIERSGATIPAAGGGRALPAAQAVRTWLDALAQGQPGESPDDAIARFASQSAAALETLGDAAEYWATSTRFRSEWFLERGVRVRADAFADASAGREALIEWQTSVRDPQFVDIGADPRIGFAQRRDALRQQMLDFTEGLTEEEFAIVRERIEALEAHVAVVDAPLEGVGEWSLANEQAVLDAVAGAGARLAGGFDQLAGAQSYLDERANIELRRRGAITRAETLISEFPDWFETGLRPLVERARDASDNALEGALDALADETQRLRVASRDLEAIQDRVESLRGDVSGFGDALRARAGALLDDWRAAVVGAPDQAADIHARVDRLVEIRDRALDSMAAIDARDGALSAPRADSIRALGADLRDAGVDPGVNLAQGRLFEILVQVTPYLDARDRWAVLRDRLAADLGASAFRSEALWHAYELLREAEHAGDPDLTPADIRLERAARDRLAATYGALPERLGAPTLLERVDAWIGARPGAWTTNDQARADIATATEIAPGEGAAAHLASARLFASVIDYAPPEDAPDDEVRARIGDFRARIVDLRPSVPGDGEWYTLLSAVDQRLSDLEAGRGGPRLDLELLATIGPGAAGWALAPASTIESPIYERDGVSMGFAIIEDFEPPFYIASDELSLRAFQQIVGAAPPPLWDIIARHTVLKDWGNSPDFEALRNEIRGYWITPQRLVELQTDWIAPPAQVLEGGVNWQAHRDLIYGPDAARSQAWSPTDQTPLHLVGFPGAWATAAAAGCRLPSPEEWASAFARADLRAGEAPNVSDGVWLRQVQRTPRGIPSPAARSFFAFGTRDAPEPFQAQDDGWLWLRPVDLAPAAPTLRDMIGNVAEWADALAGARAPEFTAESLADEDLETSARIVGVSAMSGAGAEDQVVALSRSRRDRRVNRLADVVTGGATGFPDVGLRLAFGVGDAAPKSLAGRYAQTMEDVAGVIGAGGDAP